MPSQSLDAFPSFALHPTPAPGVLDVVGPDDRTVGTVTSEDGHVARAGADTGPRRPTPHQAGGDAVMFHLARHGLPDEKGAPYSGIAEARIAAALLPLQRQAIIDASARAFTFHALRQPQVAAVLDLLEAIHRDIDAAATRAGCARLARLLATVLDPARTLYTTATGDVRDWMAYPLARLITFAEQGRARLKATADLPPADLTGTFRSPAYADSALDTLHRTWRDLTANGPSRQALDDAVANLPGTRSASSAARCRATSAQLTETATAAKELTRTATGQELVLARELTSLATDTAGRLDATALFLADGPRLGGPRALLALLRDTAISPRGPAGTRAVHLGATQLGPIRRTGDGHWTGPGIVEPYQSPEGAAVALVLLHHAQASTRSKALWR